jgi:hypothetical protein
MPHDKRTRAEIAKLRDDIAEASMTDSELIVACKNIGFDLTCGACAELFYTGTQMSAHDKNCATAQQPQLVNGHTKGPWGLRGYQIRSNGGRGQHVATYYINEADGQLIAAAPELLRLLREACNQLDNVERGAERSGTADDIRAEVRALLPSSPIEPEE